MRRTRANTRSGRDTVTRFQLKREMIRALLEGEEVARQAGLDKDEDRAYAMLDALDRAGFKVVRKRKDAR